MRSRNGGLVVTMVLASLVPGSARGQIFGKGARTEFISGLGIRSFVSLSEMDRFSVDGKKVDDPLGRAVHVRVTPIGLVYGVRPGLTLVAMLPFVDKRLSFDDGRAIGGDAGLGDATFLLKWRFYKIDRGAGTLQVATELGLKAPTGKDDLRDRQGHLLPPMLQRGTGSWDPTADWIVTYVPSAGRGRWIFSGDAGLTLTTEAGGFEQGNVVSYDGMVKYRIYPAHYPGRDTFLLLEINGRWQGRARSRGHQVADTGGSIVYLSPGVQFLLEQNVILESGVQLPLVQRLNGRQLGPSVRFLFGVRYILVP